MDSLITTEKVENVFIYTRVSTKKQVGQNNAYTIGLEAQKQICLDYYNEKFNHNLNITPIFVEDVGSSFNNEDVLKNLDNMIEDLPEKSLIFIAEISRLGRNVYQVIGKVYKPVESKSSFIVSVNDEKIFGYQRADDLYFFNKTIQSEGISIDKSIDSKKRSDLVKRAGGYVGGVPFGKKLKRESNGLHKLVRNSKEETIIRKIIKYYSNNIGPTKIAQILSNDPANKYRGKPISKCLCSHVIRKYKDEQKSLINSLSDIRI